MADHGRLAGLIARGELYAIGGKSFLHETRPNALRCCVIVVEGNDQCTHVQLPMLENPHRKWSRFRAPRVADAQASSLQLIGQRLARADRPSLDDRDLVAAQEDVGVAEHDDAARGDGREQGRRRREQVDEVERAIMRALRIEESAEHEREHAGPQPATDVAEQAAAHLVVVTVGRGLLVDGAAARVLEHGEGGKVIPQGAEHGDRLPGNYGQRLSFGWVASMTFGTDIGRRTRS